MTSVYYNEIDPDAAAWLQALMDADAIPRGEIDTRSIEDVTPNDVRGYTQCHFFAGIGGWAYALDLAGWPRSRSVWTGSCPCQPFSAAGKGAGFADERHLWPAWQHLIAQCAPPVVFGEQVASKDADAWIDLVHADMEGLGYAFGSVPFPSAGIGAPHIRDRNYWMADAYGWEQQGFAVLRGNERNGPYAGWPESGGGVAACGSTLRVGHANGATGQRGAGSILGAQAAIDCARQHDGREHHGSANAGESMGARPGPLHGFWRDADWLACTDGKWRPVEPGTFPLAHGVSARVGRLRGYGNSVVVQAAQAFIEAYLEVAGSANQRQTKAA